MFSVVGLCCCLAIWVESSPFWMNTAHGTAEGFLPFGVCLNMTISVLKIHPWSNRHDKECQNSDGKDESCEMVNNHAQTSANYLYIKHCQNELCSFCKLEGLVERTKQSLSILCKQTSRMAHSCHLNLDW